MEARLLLGSDDAQSDYGHRRNEDWEGHGIAAGQAAALGCRARLRKDCWLRAPPGVRARLHWDAGHEREGGRMWSGLLANPSLV